MSTRNRGHRLSADPVETEIKLLVDPAKIAKIERHPAFARARAATRRERTVYFDTDALELREHGFSLRIRKSGGKFVQTLKHAVAGSAIVGRRNEWEWPVKSGDLDAKPLARLARRSEALDGAYARAAPRFLTDIRRKVYALHLDGGTKVEAAVDRGTVRAGDAQEEVSELELEIKQGELGPAYRLALELAQENALRLGAESKADRGYRLAGQSPVPAKSRTAPLPARANLQDALMLVVGSALGGFVSNMPAACAGEAEAIHQMRIALRRLRTVFVLFAPHLERASQERFNEAIRETGAPLGAARDWDVFVLETLPAAACADVPAELCEELRKRAQARRGRAHLAVKHLIEGARPTELVLQIEAWIASGKWRGSGASGRLTEMLPDLFGRLRRKVRKRAKGLSAMSARELHPLRKSIKKLRYACEDARELFKEKRVDAYVKKCKKLQTLLGAINDAETTKRLVQELTNAGSSIDTKLLLTWNEERAARAHKHLATAWDKLESKDPFWS